jgi:hypothetical protein
VKNGQAVVIRYMRLDIVTQICLKLTKLNVNIPII